MPFKVCSCCATPYTQEEWNRLEYLGTQDGLDFRNCSCRSTLVVETGRDAQHLDREARVVLEYA